ncbi:hypothetical protein ACE1B6_10885 [Aerosakkonemataceae cyanobacterium BLCC-F154]|uniref:Uncharacterized protein n=1 Tax=Floridaenema fluviatile BLCC-F154 TaxID=3153640 RepID=A0ABV4YB65_9CYAN
MKQHIYRNLQSNDGLVGYWQSAVDSLQINQDGTLIYARQIYRYTAQNNVLTIMLLTNVFLIPYQQQGDTLILLINGQQITYTRRSHPNQNGTNSDRTDSQGLEDSEDRNSNPIIKAIAGVWVGEEYCPDPFYYMSHTLYLILYPDGSVGFDKTERGASWNKVSESFSYFSSGFTQNRNISGRWETDGINILIYWINSRVWQGQVDLNSGRMVMFGVGMINEGSNVMFERKM